MITNKWKKGCELFHKNCMYKLFEVTIPFIAFDVHQFLTG
jgi:hypothetical protein